jgi:hypothetical protein
MRSDTGRTGSPNSGPELLDRVLRDKGGSMTMDEAVSYALANVDPTLLAGPVIVS